MLKGLQSIGGPYPCFIECDEGADRVAATFGDNWDRMLKVKQRYDRMCFPVLLGFKLIRIQPTTSSNSISFRQTVR